MIRHRRTTLAIFFVIALIGRFASADDYDPPSDYYDYAVGRTGDTLKQHLHVLIDAVDDPPTINGESVGGEVVETPMSYDDARSTLQVTDADPSKPGHMFAVYDRTSINVAAINPGSSIPGWDSGATWNREHTWPRSRGVGSSGRDDSDLFGLRPALTDNNGDRGNLNFGGAFGAQSWGVVNDGGSKWYPGDADAGMIARQEFYMAVRYNGAAADPNTTDLELSPGDPGAAQGLGDLNRLIEWHFAATPTTFERNRNQVISTSYQHNRNPFIDHPEYAWSIFVNQTNDSQITIASPTTVDTTSGSSTKTVNLTNIIVGGVVPPAQSVTLNKSGNNGTYYSVTAGPLAASSISGSFNAFRTNRTDSTSFDVGLNANSATAGLRTGTVTIDNLDITPGSNGGIGHAANDVNDVITVNLNVLDHALPSFTTSSQNLSRTIDFGNIVIGSSLATVNVDVYNLNAPSGFTAALDLDSVASSGTASAFTTNLAPFFNLAAGASHAFTSSFNATAVGTFLATYTLTLSDENLSGANNKTLTLTLKGIARLAGDFNSDGIVNGGDYLVWRRSSGQTGVTAYSGADGDGNTIINDADFDVWRAHFGQTAPGSGSGLSSSAAVPEPASFVLLAFAAAVICRCLQRTR